jgi:hypothetical protein
MPRNGPVPAGARPPMRSGPVGASRRREGPGQRARGEGGRSMKLQIGYQVIEMTSDCHDFSLNSDLVRIHPAIIAPLDVAPSPGCPGSRP